MEHLDNNPLFPKIKAPEGYRLLKVGEPMKEEDVFWAYPGHWENLRGDSDFGYPYNYSYRPVARKL